MASNATLAFSHQAPTYDFPEDAVCQYTDCSNLLSVKPYRVSCIRKIGENKNDCLHLVCESCANIYRQIKSENNYSCDFCGNKVRRYVVVEMPKDRKITMANLATSSTSETPPPNRIVAQSPGDSQAVYCTDNEIKRWVTCTGLAIVIIVIVYVWAENRN